MVFMLHAKADVKYDPSADKVKAALTDDGEGELVFSFDTGIAKDTKHTYFVTMKGTTMDGAANTNGQINCDFTVRAAAANAIVSEVICTRQRALNGKFDWNEDGKLVLEFNAGATHTWVTFGMTTSADKFPTAGDIVCSQSGPAWLSWDTDWHVAFDNTESCVIDQRMTEDMLEM